MKPLKRSNLVAGAVTEIRQHILNGEWVIGAKLPNELELASALDISRGTLREAVRVLSSQGYLETRQGSGTYVSASTTFNDLSNFAADADHGSAADVGVAILVCTARALARTNSPEIMARIRNALLELETQLAAGRQYSVSNAIRFWDVAVGCIDNSPLRTFLQSQHAKLGDYCRKYQDGVPTEHGVYRDLLQKIGNGDPKGAGSIALLIAHELYEPFYQPALPLERSGLP
jgi:DNA-binding FadR family transcriptional regulator